MTRVPVTLSNDASSLVSDHTGGSMLISLPLLGVAIILFVFGMMKLFKGNPIKRWKLLLGFAGMWALLIVCGVIGLNITMDAKTKSVEETSKNISQSVKEKYGVTFISDSDILAPNAFDGERHRDILNRRPISATNAKGERIQITLDLTVGARDVIAYTSGTEMPKISESTPKS
jgi:predicted small metal-binding protein